jgi:hypothetical protein
VPRVFAIGLNKTGTTSLTRALQILGCSALHHDEAVEAAICRAHHEGVPLLTYAPQADAYLDIRAVEQWFDILDEQYAGSRFVLTTRDLNSWLQSRETHVLKNQARAAAGDYDGEWLAVDRDLWAREWEDHHDRVRAHFSGRDNLLELDISAGDGWEQLAPFLGVDAPEEPFPWLQRGMARTRRQRVVRRLRALFGSDPAAARA